LVDASRNPPNSPREKIAPDRRLRQSLKRFPDHSTLVLTLPPMLQVRKRSVPSIWRAPALPVSCVNASATCRTPVAPTGWPSPIKPPPALTGKRPEGRDVASLSINCAPSPRSAKPRISYCTISEIEKQSLHFRAINVARAIGKSDASFF
jgi:hypothetical protein